MFKKQPIDRAYVSNIDKALAKFKQTHPLSPAQQAEVDKYNEIYHFRDHPTAQPQKKDIWNFED